jgi:glycosyltransferase involved in cell wall biosynthesis
MARIGIDARLLAYTTGGISTYIRELLDALAENPRGHELIALYSRKQTGTPASLRSARLWTPPHHRLERWTLSAELAPLRLDVLHSTDFIPPLHGARRSVITVHDLAFLLYPEHKDAASQAYYNHQIARAGQQADQILSVSEATSADLQRLLSVPPAKITIQPHGVHPRYHPVSPEQSQPVLERFGLKPGYLLSVGTLEPRKNLPALLDAYNALRNLQADLPPLILVGRVGWLSDALMTRIQAAPGVIHIADATDSDLPALYSAASLTCLLTSYEGFGMPVLEAMACGCPVLVSDISSLPEVVGELATQNLLPVSPLVAPDQPIAIQHALQKMLGITPAQRSAWSEVACARAAQFTWRASAEIALDTYEKALSR